MDVEGPQRSDLEPVGTEYHYSDNWVAYVYVCWLGTSNFGTGPVLALFLMRLSSMLVEVCANIDCCSVYLWPQPAAAFAPEPPNVFSHIHALCAAVDVVVKAQPMLPLRGAAGYSCMH